MSGFVIYGPLLVLGVEFVVLAALLIGGLCISYGLVKILLWIIGD